MKTKLILILAGLLLCCLCVGCVAGATETLTVVYCTDQSTYPFSSTITVSGTTYTGITVKDSSNNYWRYYPSLEASSPESAKVALSGTPSSKTWNVVYEVDYLDRCIADNYDLGYAHFDSGVSMNQNSKLEIKFNVLQRSGSSGLINPVGARVGAQNNEIDFRINDDYSIEYRYGSQKYSVGTLTTNIDTTLVVNANIWSSDLGDKTFNLESFTSRSIWILGSNSGGNYNERSSNIRLYYAKIWDNNNLVRDFVPVIYGSTISLYDKTLGGSDNSNPLYNIIGTYTSLTASTSQTALTYTHTITSPPTISSISTPTSPSPINTAITSKVVASPSVVGNTLTYQWQVSTPNTAPNWDNIPSATSSTLSYTPTNPDGTYQFRCIVTETTLSTTSSVVSSLIVGKPTITSASYTIGGQTQTTGQLNTPYTLSISYTVGTFASATSLNMVLQESTDAGTTWTDKATGTYTYGGTAPALSTTVNDNSATMHVYRIRACAVSPAVSSITADSSFMSFVTYASPTVTAISINPTSKYSSESTPISLSVSADTPATGDSYSYQWKYKASTASTYTNIAGATSAAYSWSASGLSADTYDVTVDVTGLGGTTTATAQTLTISLPPAPTITEFTVTPSQASLGSTSPVTLSATTTTPVSGDTYTYVWKYKASTASSYSTIATTATNSYAWSVSQLALGNYNVVVDVIGLGGTTTSTVQTLAITSYAATLTWDSSSHTFSDTFTLQATGLSGSDAVQWYYQQTAPTAGQSTAITGATSATYQTSLQTLGLVAGNTYKFTAKINGVTDVDTPTVAAYANPIPNTPGSPLSPVAVPYTITLTASCSNEDQVASYKWQLQNGASWQQVATGQQYEVQLTQPADYVYRFVAVGKNGNEVPSVSVTVKAGYKPSAVITSPQTGTQVTAGSRIDISATVGGTNGTYSFNFGNGVSDHGTASGTVNEETKTVTTYVKYTTKNENKPITLTVSNDYGTTATYTITIENGKSTLRPTTSATVKPVDASGIYSFIGNTAPMNASNPLPNMSAMVSDLTKPITSVIGEWFYLLIFAVPYLIVFLRQKNILIPSILGVLFAAWLLVMLPGSAMRAAIGILVLCVAGGIFGLYVKRHS